MGRRSVAGICRECGVHFKLQRGHPQYPLMRRIRKTEGRMPRTLLCPKCSEKALIESHDRSTGSRYRSALNRYGAGARGDPSRLRVRVGRPWAWRELDD